MKKTLYYLIVITITISCGEIKELDTNLNPIDIKFANVTFSIPKIYKEIPLQTLKDNYQSSELPLNIIQYNVQSIENLETFPLQMLWFTDSTNYYNRILIQEGEHVKITKTASQLYSGKLEQLLDKNFRDFGIEYYRDEIKFTNGSTAQILKLKYYTVYNEFSAYTTQYIISTSKKTFAITIASTTKEDYEDLIKKIKLR